MIHMAIKRENSHLCEEVQNRGISEELRSQRELLERVQRGVSGS